MRHRFIVLICMFFCTLLSAQDGGELLSLRFEARVDYMQQYIDDVKINDNSGFKGKYLFLRMDGSFADGFSYSFRQRVNRLLVSPSFFDATDWITLSYNYRNFTFSGGKQVVAVGGYEYDAAPIDLYFCSEYWHNFACFQFGVSAAYTSPSSKDKILFQFCESPFRKAALNPENKEMYAYNLIWYGNHGFYNSISSVNFMEYQPGKYINYIVLGNRFTFGKFALELDIMNRAVSLKEFLVNDYSIMGKLMWDPLEWMRAFVYITYDRNKTVSGDLCVVPGTDLVHAGAGFEFYPIKNNRNVRLHLNCSYADGDAPLTTALRPGQTVVDAGITWKPDLLNIKRKK